MKQYTLLLDCSNVDLSLGISHKDRIIYKTSFYAWQRQSEYLIPEIKKALEEVKITFKEIKTIALGIGPGSYTGIRIPLAIAKTLAVIYQIEILPLSSLQIMGRNNEKYIALMNARSNRSYIGIYDNGKKVIEDQVIENDEIIDFISSYVDKGYVLKGNLEYCNMGINVQVDVIEGLFSHSKINKASDNALGIKPVYLKDNYDNTKR